MLLFVVCRDSAPLDDKLADRVKITSKGNLFTLSLTGCQPGDSGQYTCRSILYLRFKVNFLVKKSFQNLSNFKKLWTKISVADPGSRIPDPVPDPDPHRIKEFKYF